MRERLVALIVGGPGSGKSTLAKSLVSAAKQRKQRVRVIDPGRQFGADGVMPEDVDRYLVERRAARDVDMIVLDDADAYIGAGVGQRSAIRDLALRNRWWGVDVLITARRLQTLPPVLLSAVHHLYAFRLSPADVAGRDRLQLVTGGTITLPTEPYVFRYLDVFGGKTASGKTLPSGGYRLG